MNNDNVRTDDTNCNPVFVSEVIGDGDDAHRDDDARGKGLTLQRWQQKRGGAKGMIRTLSRLFVPF